MRPEGWKEADFPAHPCSIRGISSHRFSVPFLKVGTEVALFPDPASFRARQLSVGMGLAVTLPHRPLPSSGDPLCSLPRPWAVHGLFTKAQGSQQF